MNSHRTRNSKTGLMYIMAVCFLIFSQTGFNQLDYMLFSLTGALMGSDLTVFKSPIPGSVSNNALFALDEQKIRNFMD